MSEEIIQGTDAWKMLRLGKVTASRVKDIVATTKSGYSTASCICLDLLNSLT